MQKAFTSGACGPAEQQGLAANPFTNFMDHLLTGGAAVAEQSAGYMSAEQMAAMEAEKQAIAQQQAMAMQEEQRQILAKELQQHLMESSKPQEANFEEMNALFENMSLEAPAALHELDHISAASAPAAAKEISAAPITRPQVGGMPMMGGGMMHRPVVAGPVDNKGFDELSQLFEKPAEEVKVAGPDDQKAKVVSQDLINFLESSSNPKFKESKFLRFLKKISCGAYKIVDKELEKDRPKLAEFKAKEAASKLEESKEGTDQLFEKAFAQFEKNYKQAQEGTLEAQIEKFYNMAGANPEQALEGLFQEQDFFDGLADQYPEEEEEAAPQNYQFQVKNPFLELGTPMEAAEKFAGEQNVDNAILALEAEVQKQPENSEAWRRLGLLHQENDQDEKALLCLRKGFEVDPLNQEILIALGVSSINELQEINALQNLENWFRIHPDYGSIPIPEGLSDGEALKLALDKACEAALAIRPGDPDVFVIKGVLDFLGRQYPRAKQTFLEGVRLNPTDHTLWNKLGAALANSNQNEQAMLAYHQAIELRPTFVRAWANLGISCHNLGQHYESANYYLCALALNPDASHIWNYLQTSFIAMNRYDLIAKMKDRDVRAFSDEFEVVSKEKLHKPNLTSCHDNPLLTSAP